MPGLDADAERLPSWDLHSGGKGAERQGSGEPPRDWEGGVFRKRCFRRDQAARGSVRASRPGRASAKALEQGASVA